MIQELRLVTGRSFDEQKKEDRARVTACEEDRQRVLREELAIVKPRRSFGATQTRANQRKRKRAANLPP